MQKNVACVVPVANFAASPQKLAKGQVIGSAIPAPATIITVNLTENDEPSVSPATQADISTSGSCTERTTTPTRMETDFSQHLRNQQATDVVLTLNHHTSVSSLSGKPFPEKSTEQAESNDNPPSTVYAIDLSHLPADIQSKVREMLDQYSDMWQGQLGKISVTEHRIKPKEGSEPVYCQPYRAGPRAREAERKQVQDMLQSGVIEPASSEWASPVVLVPKQDGSLRFCVDYRKLNNITVKDTYPLPRMDECLDSLGDARWFTTLDCNAGYWQLRVAEEDRDKTTFTCHCGTYRFCRMPLGYAMHQQLFSGQLTFYWRATAGEPV